MKNLQQQGHRVILMMDANESQPVEGKIDMFLTGLGISHMGGRYEVSFHKARFKSDGLC